MRWLHGIVDRGLTCVARWISTGTPPRRVLRMSLVFLLAGIGVGLILDGLAVDHQLFGVPVAHLIAGSLLVFGWVGTFVVSNSEHDRNTARDRAQDFRDWTHSESLPELHTVAWEHLLRIVREDAATYGASAVRLAVDSISRYLTEPCLRRDCDRRTDPDVAGRARFQGSPACSAHPVSERWFEVAWHSLLSLQRLLPDDAPLVELKPRGTILRSAHVATRVELPNVPSVELDLTQTQLPEDVRLQISDNGGLVILGLPRECGAGSALTVRTADASGLTFYGSGTMRLEGTSDGRLTGSKLTVEPETKLTVMANRSCAVRLHGINNKGTVTIKADSSAAASELSGIGGPGVVELTGTWTGATCTVTAAEASENAVGQVPAITFSDARLTRQSALEVTGFRAHPTDTGEDEPESDAGSIAIDPDSRLTWTYPLTGALPTEHVTFRACTFTGDPPSAAPLAMDRMNAPQLSMVFAGPVSTPFSSPPIDVVTQFTRCRSTSGRLDFDFRGASGAAVYLDPTDGQDGFDASSVVTVSNSTTATVYTLDPVQVLGAPKSSILHDAGPERFAPSPAPPPRLNPIPTSTTDRRPST